MEEYYIFLLVPFTTAVPCVILCLTKGGANMARLLIADDELYTLDGILQCIDFTRLGISEVQTAADGLAAIRLLDTYQPDILLTDVRMPHADGIALSKHIRENLPSCQIVFMSGYSDTAYLKAAIELKALNYIEKPFLLSELYEALEKAVSAHQEYQLLHEKNLAFHTALTHLRSAFLNTLIDQPIFQEPSPEKIAALGSTLRPSSFLQTAILKLDVYQVEKIYGRGGLRHILTQLETTLTARNLPVFFSIHSPGEILLLVFDSEGAQKAQTYLKAVCEEIPRALHGFDFFLIGIGSLEQGLQQVRHSYEAAQVSLEFGFYGKHGSVVNAKGASTRPVLEPHLPDLQAYMRLIQSEKKEESILSLKSYTENICNQFSQSRRSATSTSASSSSWSSCRRSTRKMNPFCNRSNPLCICRIWLQPPCSSSHNIGKVPPAWFHTPHLFAALWTLFPYTTWSRIYVLNPSADMCCCLFPTFAPSSSQKPSRQSINT